MALQGLHGRRMLVELAGRVDLQDVLRTWREPVHDHVVPLGRGRVLVQECRLDGAGLLLLQRHHDEVIRDDGLEVDDRERAVHLHLDVVGLLLVLVREHDALEDRAPVRRMAGHERLLVHGRGRVLHVDELTGPLEHEFLAARRRRRAALVGAGRADRHRRLRDLALLVQLQPVDVAVSRVVETGQREVQVGLVGRCQVAAARAHRLPDAFLVLPGRAHRPHIAVRT